MAQLVKNPSTMPVTWVQSLGWEDTLEKGKASLSSIQSVSPSSVEVLWWSHISVKIPLPIMAISPVDSQLLCQIPIWGSLM